MGATTNHTLQRAVKSLHQPVSLLMVWAGVLLISWMRSIAPTWRTTSEVKLVPWPVRMVSGRPTREKKVISASAMVSASIDDSGIASG